MRRAAVQVFRAARRPVLRKASRARLSISEINHALGWRALSSQRERRASLILLNSSMRFPTLAFGAAIAAGGGYYLYNSQNTSSQPVGASPVAPGEQTRSLTTSASPVQTSEEVARRALLLDQGGQLFSGDSRAVLGRRGASGKWTATPLSVDQTGATESEAQRMRAEHPGEPNVVMNGRVLGGLEPTRAFGDAIYKWSIETQEKIKQTYFGRTPSKLLRTPPYVTAEPVVTTTKVDPEKGDFVVMATDGLWEMLTNEEVVGLVGMWLDEQAKHSKKAGANSSNSWLASWYQQKGLPVEKPGEKRGAAPKGNNDGGQRVPVRVQQWGVTGTESERFLVQDKNAATHLVRNALGGKDHDQVCALLTLPAPYARRYRDDLTVEVIFFGQGEDTGAVTPNKDASASFEKAAKL